MPSVSEISSRYVDEVAALDPVRGERWGVATDGTRLTDYSPEGVAALADLLRRTIRDVGAATPTDESERLGQGFLADWAGGELGIIEAESEVLRYLSWPSQATAYKLGERTWLAGRDAASAAASASGQAFDRRAWHASALALGPLGLRRLGTELAPI